MEKMHYSAELPAQEKPAAAASHPLHTPPNPASFSQDWDIENLRYYVEQLAD